jgi:hypothetical protein
MHAEPFQVLRATGHRTVPSPRKPRLIIAGATGVLGNEVMRRLVGLMQFENTEVLARERFTDSLRGATTRVVPSDDPQEWPPSQADLGVVLFEPPRLCHQRERALWTGLPQQLPQIAAWLRRSGVHTLAIVLPHEQGRLPEALKRGLASLDEHAVAQLGFERLLIVRTPRKPGAGAARGLARVAQWMLSISRYMIPDREQPVRAAKVAEFVSTALQLAPPGIHVAAPETVWRAAQGDVQAVVRDWLRT